MVTQSVPKPPQTGSMYDHISMLWEAYSKGEFIGLYASEEEAASAALSYKKVDRKKTI